MLVIIRSSHGILSGLVHMLQERWLSAVRSVQLTGVQNPRVKGKNNARWKMPERKKDVQSKSNA